MGTAVVFLIHPHILTRQGWSFSEDKGDEKSGNVSLPVFLKFLTPDRAQLQWLADEAWRTSEIHRDNWSTQISLF
jgi:hypothetical protein